MCVSYLYIDVNTIKYEFWCICLLVLVVFLILGFFPGVSTSDRKENGIKVTSVTLFGLQNIDCSRDFIDVILI